MHFPRSGAFLFIAVTAASAASTNDTGLDWNRLPQFPLAKLLDGPAREGVRIAFDGVVAEGRGGEVILRGSAASGKRWEAHLPAPNFGHIYRADIDGDGTADYVIFSAGGAASPVTRMTVLLMDRQGLPVPFEASVPAAEGGRSLIDLGGGHAGLLVSTSDRSPWDSRVDASCSGHWTTQLYRAENYGWVEFRGAAAGLTFSFVHRWMNCCRLCVANEEAPPLRPAPAPPLPNSGTSAAGALTGTMNGIPGCGQVAAATIVYDRRDLREVAFAAKGSSYLSGLVDRITSDNARIELRGVNRTSAGCSANLLWATK
ncbi:MAG: hypothetical protein ABI165_08185 [Bryobacteraceae bacterium]